MTGNPGSIQAAEDFFEERRDAGGNVCPDLLFFILDFQEHAIQRPVGKVFIQVGIHFFKTTHSTHDGTGKQIPFSGKGG